MKKIILAVLATAALTGSAFAADMRPAPAMVAPAPSWTGCYLNAGWGYGLLDDERYGTGAGGRPNSTSAAKGWLGSFGGGCDYQIGGSFLGPLVIGAFADYAAMNLTGNYGDPFNDTHYGRQTMRDAWYVGGRAGVLVTPNLLSYVNIGWTGGHINRINILTASGGPVLGGLYLPGQNVNGWFLGSGLEYAITSLPVRGLFWRNEYRYANYDNYNQNYIHTDGLPGIRTVHNRVDVQTITSSLVWRFGY
jgi:outer membrane immunogenic protein